MQQSFSEQVAALLTQHGLDPAEAALQGAFCEALRAANEAINLTGITDAPGMAVRHVLDSLLAREIVADSPTDRPLVDLGSGGGVPGIPLALALPEREVVLVESRERKAAALGRIVETLGLAPRVRAVHARGERWLADQTVDAVLTRAVGSTAEQLRMLSPVRTSFRRLIMFKGPAVDAELCTTRSRFAKLGFAEPARHEFTLPDGAGRRTLLVFTTGDEETAER
ncbi:MAG: 16S rRNA (guanine(527)-N(7))-methyltransferase RsmG [Planctomycetaceae bacterium]